VKIKIERPDRGAATDVFAKYLTTDIPFAESETRDGGVAGAITAMTATAVEAMYALSEENRFLEVTYSNGDKRGPPTQGLRLWRHDRVRRARAKKLALKRYIGGGQKGIMADDLLNAIREESRRTRIFPIRRTPTTGRRSPARRVSGSCP